jgi:hypothetical protein
MGVSLDLRRAHHHRQHGDIIAVYTWVNDERALVLLPAHRQGAPWFVVCESAAYTWDDEDPKNIAEVVRKGTKACEVLGIEPTPHNVRRVAAIIIDGLPDLIRMPHAPEPEKMRHAIGEMKLMADGQMLSGAEIRLDKEAPTYA